MSVIEVRTPTRSWTCQTASEGESSSDWGGRLAGKSTSCASLIPELDSSNPCKKPAMAKGTITSVLLLRPGGGLRPASLVNTAGTRGTLPQNKVDGEN